MQPLTCNWSEHTGSIIPVADFHHRTLKRFVKTICTSLQRQFLRRINAWYFYTDISAGSNGDFGGKEGRNSDCRLCSFRKSYLSVRLQTFFRLNWGLSFSVSNHFTHFWKVLKFLTLSIFFPLLGASRYIVTRYFVTRFSNYPTRIKLKKIGSRKS